MISLKTPLLNFLFILVITKEEYKRLAGVEKAFLKVKDLNREMFEIMLYETMKKKPDKVAANLMKK